MSICLEELNRSGLVSVDYPLDLRSAVENAVSSWKEFCQLPKQEKCAFTFLEDSHGDGAGYELKEEKGSKKDLKENFHVTLFQIERLTKICNERTFPFLHNAQVLLDKIETIVIPFVQQIQEEYDIPGLDREVKESKPYWILRYLHYFGDQPPRAEIAAAHADKGGFTLHLYESDPGLQYYSQDHRQWEEMPVNHHQTVIIGAMQLQLRSKGKLKALYHRVIANEKTAQTGRFSMVCFVPFEYTPHYNKKALGSMQTHQPAFNYDISFEEFKNYFL